MRRRRDGHGIWAPFAALVAGGLTLGGVDVFLSIEARGPSGLSFEAAVLLAPAVVAVLMLAGACLGVVALPAGWLASRSRRDWSAMVARPAVAGMLLGASAVVALAAILELRTAPAGEPGRGIALVIALLASALPALPLARRGLERRAAPVWVLGLALVALGMGLLTWRADVRWMLYQRSVMASTALDLWAGLADPDRDGYPGLGLGPDCAPFDRDVNPGALDLPGSSRDEDCIGGDAPIIDASRPPSPPPGGLLSGRSVVLVTLESISANRLAALGSRRMVTPVLDLVSDRATLFAGAHANSADTVGSVHSLLTGRYPRQTRFSAAVLSPDDRVILAGDRAPRRSRALPRLPARDTAPTLAQTLRSAGYDTMAVVCCGWQQRGSGLLRGFGTVDDVPFQTRNREGGGVAADVVVRQAILLANRARGRFLLWIHIPDPSPPYHFHGGTPYFGDSPADLHDGEVSFADAQVGILLDDLERSGLLQTTIVVLACARGGGRDPGRASGLGQDVLRVPLLLWLPGQPSRRIDAPVENTDIVPTVLDLLGVPAPAGIAGQSLVPLIVGERSSRLRPDVVAQDPGGPGGPDRRALIQGDWKLVEDKRRGTVEVYHLPIDPLERQNLASSGIPVLPRLRARLSAWTANGPP